ncbi:HU domain-containing protein [Chitinophaga lutea]
MLQQYITEVLFKQQACSVPQVGTFTIQHIPAHYSVVDQVLTPPRRQINFETRWEDDGSFLHWISQRENLVEAVARIKMDKYLQDFRETLQTGQPVDLPGIGNLRLDPFGQVLFTPQEQPDAWRPISVQPVLRPEVAPKVLQGNTEVVNQEVVEHMTVVPDSYESQGRFRWWWVALPLIVIAAGLSWFLLKEHFAGYSLVEEKPEPVAPAPPPPPAPDTTTAVAAVPPVSDSILYYVVFQEFKARKDAEKMYNTHQKWDHPEVVLYAGKDSVYNLAVAFRTLPADTTMAKDSVRNKYKAKVWIEY